MTEAMKNEGAETSREKLYTRCTLCPRNCGADRTKARGFCGMGARPRAARAALHMWEEPCLTGKGGCGAVFFSGCTLRCCYCQNRSISAGGFGKDLDVRELADIFLRLRDQGAECLDLVTASHFLPSVLDALDLVKEELSIPVVWNTGGYEKIESLRMLEGYADIYLPDFKYLDPALSGAYSAAPDYAEKALPAVEEMVRQTGAPAFGADGLLKRGTLIRHLVLPGCRHDSMDILTQLKKKLPEGSFLISVMSQYTPPEGGSGFPALDRRVTTMEYESVVDRAAELGLPGYMQERRSAKEEYIPPFDLTGL